MISHITITLEEDGFWRLSAGDVVVSRHPDPQTLLLEIRGHLSKLAFFPSAGTPLNPDPVPFEKTELRAYQQTARDKEKQKRAEQHLTKLNAAKPAEPVPLPNPKSKPTPKHEKATASDWSLFS